MSQSLVLPTDNAVIDYSLISQMMTAINNLQSQINTLTPAPVATTGGGTAVPLYKYHVYNLGTTKTITVNAADFGLSSFLSLTGSVYTGSSSTGGYAWISSLNTTQAVFTLSATPTSTWKFYVVAIGT